MLTGRALLLAGLFSFLAIALAHADTASYLAKHRPAAELAGLAALAMRSARPHLTADEKSDRVVIDGPAEAVRSAVKLLGELDVAPRAIVVEIEVVEAAQVTWRARLAAFSGVTAKARRGDVDLRVTATWLDGRYDVRAYADVGKGNGRVTVKGQARVAEGARVEIAVVAGIALAVRVTPAK